MKRASVLVATLVVALSMAVALVGCSSGTYTPQTKDQTVSNSALKSSGTLRVGVNASNAPYAAESSGTIVGIDVDIAAAIADEMGLKLELVDVGSSVDSAFSKDNVDIVMGVSKSSSAYWTSDSYMSSAVALFSLTQNATAPTSSGSFSVAAQSSSMSAWEVSDHYGESCLRNTTDLQSAFESLQTGSVNYVAADSTIGEYVVHSSSVQAYPVALLQDPASYSVATTTTNAALQQAISEALSSLKNGGIINVIQKKWLGDQADISSLKVIKSTKSDSSSSDTSSSTTTSSTGTSGTSDTGSSSSSSTSGASGTSSNSASSGSNSTSGTSAGSGTGTSTSTSTKSASSTSGN